LYLTLGISAEIMATLRETWKRGMEEKWGNHFGCCDAVGCDCRCVLTFTVEWVDSNEHHTVAVHVGPSRSDMTNWDTMDTGVWARSSPPAKVSLCFPSEGTVRREIGSGNPACKDALSRLHPPNGS
jgi:hypothetical protein